ncbi:hypothetical protein KHU50_011133 [Colletotrichum sp. SAR 10_65]|nr:hypothetical protein KHU50_011133 [Colletotrichum sp. SAR 10_65]KAI8210978.1 hypothetical protein K4K52_011320 [Colletotrichum sp. SAR 10_76]KAJ5003928.1 hypothetical protein K4K48_011027 [Colletotrichum sp. SAR 10_66]
MADCASISGPLNATGDIVGYGILAAFLVSAVVTITAVLLAYYFDAIEDDLIIDVDRKFRSEFRAMAKFIEQIFRWIRSLSFILRQQHSFTETLKADGSHAQSTTG